MVRCPRRFSPGIRRVCRAGPARRLAFLLFAGSLWFITSAGAPAAADDAAIGYVKFLTGTATVTRHGAAHPLGLGMPVYTGDQLYVAEGAELGVTFRDDTRISLGPRSRLDLKHFTFKPAEQQYGFIIRLLHGTLHYLSGLNAKLSPDTTAIETPSFTAGVRGTRLLIRESLPDRLMPDGSRL